MSAPRVAIVVPAFNAERFLTQTIQSVQAQTVADWELVIVDDGSTDDTARVAQQCADADARIRIVRQPNGGVSRARNRGLEEIGPAAQTVAFLDADDVWEPHMLRTLWDTLQASPDAAGAHGLARFVDAQCRPLQSEQEANARNCRVAVDGALVPLPADAPTTFAVLLCQNSVPASGILLRREAVVEAGGFDPSLSLAEDWDYWLRVSSRADIAFAGRVVYNYRQHENNASRQGQRMFAAQRRVRRKAVVFPAFTADQKRLAAQVYRLVEREQARHFLDLAAQQMRCGKPIRVAKLLRRAVVSLCMSALRPVKM